MLYLFFHLLSKMKFKDLLKTKLSLSIKEDLLPASYQQIGDIILVKLKPEVRKYEKEIGMTILDLFKSVSSVYLQESIYGKLRQPKIRHLAGKRSTITIVNENHCKYKINISEVMFSKGNQEEKRRIVKQIKKNEVILDMFAGIGYFTIPIAKLTNCKKVYAIDLNPESIKLLKENIKLNKVEEKVKVFLGDSKILPLSFSKKFDRILLGYLPDAEPFLKTAFSCSKKGTIIHYHGISSNKGLNLISQIKKQARESELLVEILNAKKIKAYAPKKEHYVIDFRVLIS